MSNLAVIPARGGSRGIPRKNLIEVANRPLIAWTIAQAREARSIDRVIVTTDSSEIAEVARAWGAETPFLRPADISTDTATTEAAMFHVMDWLESEEGYIPDHVALLQPTCPVRNAGTIDAGLDLLLSSKADSVVGVREIHPFLWTNPTNATAQYNYLNRPRRQDVAEPDRLYEETGCFYAAKTSVMRTTGNRLGGRIVLFPMTSDESIDIDTEADIVIASAILGAQRNS